MTDFLDQKRAEIAARLNELKPLVAEYERLEAAAAALEGVSAPSAPAGPPKRAPARPRKARTKNTAANAGGRRGRTKGSGKRAEEALALVKANPGITIPEIAEQIGIKQNYLYRVLPTLANEGRVKKDGRGWHPIEAG